MPAVSVLLPVRDAEATLETALRSVARQSEARFECIIVDDACSDGSRRIAGEFAAGDPRFQVIEGAGLGLVAALQRGLEACTAPFIARMDADDWMHRERLALQLEWLDRDPTLSGVGCQVRLFPRPLGAGMRRYENWLAGIETPDDVAREAFIECPIAHPTLMMRSDVLRRVGYRDQGWPEDHDLILRLLASGARLGVVPRRLHGWRDEPSRLSRNHPAYRLARFSACRAHFLARGFLAAADQYVLWGYGETGRALCRDLARLGKRPAQIVEVHPRRIGNEIQGARVVAPESLARRAEFPIIVSVSGAGPRGEIRAALGQMNYVEVRDFICAA